MPVTSAATSITRKKIPTTKRVVTAVPANSPSDRKRRRFNCDGRTEKETKTGEVDASSGRGSASTEIGKRRVGKECRSWWWPAHYREIPRPQVRNPARA